MFSSLKKESVIPTSGKIPNMKLKLTAATGMARPPWIAPVTPFPFPPVPRPKTFGGAGEAGEGA